MIHKAYPAIPLCGTSIRSVAVLLTLLLLSPGILSAQDGWKWSKVDSGVSSSLRAISIPSKEFGVAVGHNSTVLKYSDGKWMPFGGEILSVKSEGVELAFPGLVESDGWGEDAWFQAVTVVDRDTVWIGSYGKTTEQRGLSLWNGTVWSPRFPDPPRDRVLCLWNDGADMVFGGGGAPGRVIRFDGEKWLNFPVEYHAGFYRGIHGKATETIWAVGHVWENQNGEEVPRNIIHTIDGGITWEPHNAIQETEAATLPWNAVFRLDETHVWMVGNRGRIAFWDGTNLTMTEVTTSSISKPNLNAVCALDERNVWAVGDHGVIFHLNGTEWTPVHTGFAHEGNFYDVTLDSDGHIWVVGDDGTILHAKPDSSL